MTDFFVDMVSASFQGKVRRSADVQTYIARHRAVNALLAPEFGQGLHALSLRLKTPEEIAKEQQSSSA